MQYLIEHHEDKHFIDNVRLAGEWGEENEFVVKFAQIGGTVQEIYPVIRIMVRQYAFGHTVLRYKVENKSTQTIDISQVTEVSWRPDIRRHAND